MYRAVNKDLPQNFEFYFTRIENMHRYKLRSIKSKTFHSKAAKKTKTVKYRNWITNSGVDVWNDIPAHFKNLGYKPFAKKFKTSIIDSY